MNLINYLQSSDGIRMTAFVASSIILIAFCHRLLKKRQKPTPEDLWTAEGYYNYLLAVIKASTTNDELGAAWFMVENTWFTKTFRYPVNRFARNRYYSKLADAYAKKETELTKIPVELCKN